MSISQSLQPAVPFNQPSARQPPTLSIRPDLGINILVPSMTLGGAEKSVYDIWTGLASRDPVGKLFLLHDVTPCYPISSTGRLEVIPLAKIESGQRWRRIALEVLASPSPVLFTHMIHARDLSRLWELGVQTIPVIQNSQPSWQDDVTAFDHPNVPYLIAVSGAVAKQLTESGCKKPVVVLRHEIQQWYTPEELQQFRDEIRGQYGIKPDTLLIGMVGQFKVQKAYPRAARVLHGVQQFGSAKLMILGGWDHDYGSGRTTYTATCRQALELGVMPDLLMPGSVYPVERFYPAFDVFLNTSLYEGLSVSVLEAIHTGCPVVTADAGGNREVLPANSYLIEDGSDIDAYVEAICRTRGMAQRSIPKPPSDTDLIPNLWCLLTRYGTPRIHEQGSERTGTLFVTHNMNLGGAQRSLVNLLSHLHGHRCFLAILSTVFCEPYLKAIEDAGVPVFSLRDSKQRTDQADRLLYLLERLNVRNICFWNVDAKFKLLLATVLRLRDIRLIDVSPGPMLFDELQQAEAFQQRIAFTADEYLERLDCFVAKYTGGGPARSLNAKLDDRVDNRLDAKVVVIPNGVPAPPGERKDRPSKLVLPQGVNPKMAIGTCCRITPSKRLEFLLEMMERLSKQVPEASLTIVGGVDPRQLEYWEQVQAKLKCSGLQNVHFVGGHADVYPYLRNFKVFVMISEDQGCPNASLEALSLGIPVVANSSGGTREQIEHGVNGYLVSDTDPADMADKVSYLLNHPRVLKQFSNVARKTAQEKFAMQRMVDRYLEVLCGS